MSVMGHIIRFIVSALVLLFVSFIVPGFSVGGFWSALVLALVIAAIGWVIESMFGTRISPFGRGLIGFLTSALIIYLAQFLVANTDVTWLGAILAALVIGVIDLFVPISTPLDRNRSKRMETVS